MILSDGMWPFQLPLKTERSCVRYIEMAACARAAADGRTPVGAAGAPRAVNDSVLVTAFDHIVILSYLSFYGTIRAYTYIERLMYLYAILICRTSFCGLSIKIENFKITFILLLVLASINKRG
jgi:hypothetical protein